MTLDLRTRYLGLDLGRPSWRRRRRSTASRPRPRWWNGREPRRSSCPRCSRRRSSTTTPNSTRRSTPAWSGSPRRSSYFPNYGSFLSRADRYLDRLERIKARVAVPVIASLNASTPGGWVALCATHAGRGCRCAGAQPLPPRRRPAPVRSRHGGGGPGADRGGPRLGRASRSRSSSARTTRRSRTSRPRPSAAARTGWCCSTASTSPTWTSTRSTSCRVSS